MANDALESRKMLIQTAFPYLEIEPTVTKEENYDAYFDELEAILAAQKESQEKAAAVGDQAEK